MVNLQGDDYGGELDPHGADQRGNPLGKLSSCSADLAILTTPILQLLGGIMYVAQPVPWVS